MNEQNITDFIIETVLSQPSILGSQLGTKVKQKFQFVDKLKPYIDRNCGGQVICIGRRGTDLLYSHISRVGPNTQRESPPAEAMVSPAIPASVLDPSRPRPFTVGETVGTVQLPVLTPRTVSVWSAFTNPSIADRLAINATTMEFQVIPPHRWIQPPVVGIPKVKPEEHHKIAGDFLPEIEPEDQQHFQQESGQPIVWATWSLLIKDFAGGKYFSRWLDFRTEALYKLLANRLAELGFDKTVSEPLLEKLLQSKRRPPQMAIHATTARQPLSAEQTPMSESELRRIATIAISGMSADELRRLSFPLGVIINAMSKKAS